MNFQLVNKTKAKVCRSCTNVTSEFYKKLHPKESHNANENIISSIVTIHNKKDWIIMLGSCRTSPAPCLTILIDIDIV